MNSRKNKLAQIKNLHLILLAVICAAAISVAGCSSEAQAGKGSSKKSKQAKSEPAEDETESKDEESAAEEHSEDAEKSDKEESEKSVKAEKTSKAEKAGTKKGEKKESAKSEKEEADKNVSAKAIWANLIKGNQRFVAGKQHAFQAIAARRELAKAQHPQAMILGCADSRLSPELIFDQNMGDLFVVRTAGNVADAVALGSLEYAAEHLHAKVLIVLGHESCGAVAAAISGEKMPTKNLSAIVSRIQPAFEDSEACATGGKGAPTACVKLNVALSAKEILAKSPILREKVEAGELTIIRAVYSLETGEVTRIEKTEREK